MTDKQDYKVADINLAEFGRKEIQLADKRAFPKRKRTHLETIEDSAGKEIGKPIFNDDGQEFSTETITYNFETKNFERSCWLARSSGSCLRRF